MTREQIAKTFENATEEQISAILNLNSTDIGKAKGEYDTLKKDLETANKAISEFEEMDIESIKKSADEWKEKHKKETGELNEKLQKQILNSKLEIGLLGAKAKNVKAVKALLDLEQIKLEGESLVGFNEQLEKITGENPYLFGEQEKNPTPGAGQETTIDDLTKWREEAGLPTTK